MKTCMAGGGSLPTTTRVATSGAALTVGNFCYGVKSTGRCTASATSSGSATQKLGMVMTPVTAAEATAGATFECAEAIPGAEYVIPFYDDATVYEACVAAAKVAKAAITDSSPILTIPEKYAGQVGFAGYMGGTYGMVLGSDGVAYLNLANTSQMEFQLNDVEYDSMSDTWLAKVSVIPAVNQRGIIWG